MIAFDCIMGSAYPFHSKPPHIPIQEGQNPVECNVESDCDYLPQTSTEHNWHLSFSFLPREDKTLSSALRDRFVLHRPRTSVDQNWQIWFSGGLSSAVPRLNSAAVFLPAPRATRRRSTGIRSQSTAQFAASCRSHWVCKLLPIEVGLQLSVGRIWFATSCRRKSICN